jgi:hypothetical protein
MRGKQHLNGSDYLMLGFDQELRRHGFAGNSCQIVLKLGAAISPEALQQRLEFLWDRYLILSARPGGLILPRWKLPQRSTSAPRIRVHRDERALSQRLFNEPLAINRGELLRFDLIERDGGPMDLIFTWTHALMDAPGAEHFLAIIGHEELPLPAPPAPPPGRARLGLRNRCKLAWKNLYQIDQFCRAAPRSLGIRHRDVPPLLRYRVEKFTTEETARVRANGVRLCGLLGDAQYHAVVAVSELHALHQRLGRPSPSYVLPIAVGLRPKGSTEPLFSNQVGMMMTQFLPEHLDSLEGTVATLKTQTTEALRSGLIESGRVLTELFRFLPLPIYMAILKHGLRGEICSLFYGDTAAVSPLLTTFMGVPVNDFIHVAAVTPSPGIGVIFYYFRGELRVTVLHLATVLTEAEADEFATNLRARLLSA